MNINDNSENLIKQLISKKSEGDFWDYKFIWHKSNDDLLKDIICFANSVHYKDCYILFGVNDKGDVIGVENTERKRQADVQDLLSNVDFAGGYRPNISVFSIYIEEKLIDVLLIYNTCNVPIYLNKPNGKLKSGHIYQRVGDRNTSDNCNSEYPNIELLWKKRFGMLYPTIEHIYHLMEKKYDWLISNDVYYNIYKPEYNICIEDYVYESISDYDPYDQEEYFLDYEEKYYDSPNYYAKSEGILKTVLVKYNGFVLHKFEGRTFFEDNTIVINPIVRSIRDNVKHNYCYYIQNSESYKMTLFLNDYIFIKNEKQSGPFMEILVFYNEDEHNSFIEYIEENYQKYSDSRKQYKNQFLSFLNTSGSKIAKSKRNKWATIRALEMLLKEFRSIN